MARNITWPKECRQYAKDHNRDLFAFGMDGRDGKAVATCNVPHGVAGKLLLFCLKVTREKDPFLTFSEVYHKSTWTQEPPIEQGEYWHWNGDADCCPMPTFVLGSSAPGKKCFVSIGQLGITQPIDCDKYGGWWLRMVTPKVPSAG